MPFIFLFNLWEYLQEFSEFKFQFEFSIKIPLENLSLIMSLPQSSKPSSSVGGGCGISHSLVSEGDSLLGIPCWGLPVGIPCWGLPGEILLTQLQESMYSPILIWLPSLRKSSTNFNYNVVVRLNSFRLQTAKLGKSSSILPLSLQVSFILEIRSKK